MKKEYITPKELKKIMKLSIAINVDLGFYVSFTGKYLTIDQYDNCDPQYTKDYYFTIEDLHEIMTHIKAYTKLHNRRLHIV